MFNYKKVAKLNNLINKQRKMLDEQDALMAHMKSMINRLCKQLGTGAMMPKIKQGLPKITNPNMTLDGSKKALKRPWGLISTHLKEIIAMNEMMALYDADTLAKIITKSNPVYEAATALQIYQCKEWSSTMILRKKIRSRKSA